MLLLFADDTKVYWNILEENDKILLHKDLDSGWMKVTEMDQRMVLTI